MEKESLGVLPGMERDAEEASRLDDLARAAGEPQDKNSKAVTNNQCFVSH